MATEPKYFIEQFAEDVLADLGIANLNETERADYLPGIIHNIEIRLGAALLPFVPDNAAEEFQELTDNDASSEQWTAFWQKHVPDYQTKVEQALREFVDESRGILAK